MINLHESMGPGRDRTRDPWICSQTRICCQTRYRLRYAARYLHWFDFLACLYSLDLRRTILFKSLLYQGSDFLFLLGIFLSMDCSMPDLKESHKFSTVEEGGALVISLESRSMSTKMLSQFAFFFFFHCKGSNLLRL